MVNIHLAQLLFLFAVDKGFFHCMVIVELIRHVTLNVKQQEKIFCGL